MSEKNSKIAISVIASELTRIANELEELPMCECGTMSNEQMMRMQKIDFCSQRLQDLSSLVTYLSSEFEVRDSDIASKMSDLAKLEHTRDLFQ